MNSISFKNVTKQIICLHIIYIQYMYKQDSALNNLLGLIYRKSDQPTFYLSIYLSIYLSHSYLSIYLSIYLSDNNTENEILASSV